MTFVATGLTNGGTSPGGNFSVTYDNSLDAADGVDRGNALLAVVDGDLSVLSNLFQGIGLPFAFPIPLEIVTGAYGGAGWQNPPNLSTITLRPGNGQKIDLVRYLVASEVAEQFMDKKANGWGYSFGDGNEGSKGEGLSRWCGFKLMQTQGLDTSVLSSGGQTFFVSNQWLTSSRGDWINQNTLNDNHPDANVGCTTLFIYYLNTQLAFDISTIIDNGAATMAGVYNKLTKDVGDPFPFFSRLVGHVFPGTNQINEGPNFDNPFPIGILSFWVDNSTFGKDQVQDLINTKGGVASSAFWLVLEGFSITSFNKFGITLPSPTGTFLSLSGVSIQPTPGVPSPQFEDSTDLLAPQRIRFSFDVTFTTTNAFPALGGQPVIGELDAEAFISGAAFPGATTSTVFELLGGEDPYFSNIDPSNTHQEPYLSQDLRVFPVAAGVSVLGGPFFTSDPYQSLQDLLQYLNGTPTFTNPQSLDPFNTNSLPGQTGYETGDSSVYAINAAGNQNYNFAIARVRLRGSSLAEADNVRVFFRLWIAPSCDTDYQPSTTYPSTLGASGADLGNPIFPLPSGTGLKDPTGQTVQTIPFFATGATGSNDYTGTAANGNMRKIQIPNNSDQVWAYYGCFLDVFNTDNSPKFGGTHHCIVAQIAYDGAPIPTVTSTGSTPTTSNWDKLAQRNLQITLAKNPTSPATHVVPQAFDLRPTRALSGLPGSLASLPDELMIDWGNTPVGSTASIYWPQLNSADVLALANQVYSTHLLLAADANTLQCTVTNGVTYIPIPAVPSGTVNFAGLFTVDLPDAIKDTQYFRILVRRITSRRIIRPPPPIQIKSLGVGSARRLPNGPTSLTHTSAHSQTPAQHQSRHTHLLKARAQDDADTDTVAIPTGNPDPATPEQDYIRQMSGAFQISIPVTNAGGMLWQEENTLAVLTWRLQHMSPVNRWYPVLQRYISLVSARIKGLGGDPGSIPPTLGGIPPTKGGGKECPPGPRCGSCGGETRCHSHDRPCPPGPKCKGCGGETRCHGHARSKPCPPGPKCGTCGGETRCHGHGSEHQHERHGPTRGHGMGALHGHEARHGHESLHDPHTRRPSHRGRVESVTYDACGEYEGFTLRTEDGREVEFGGKSSGMEDLINDAWKFGWGIEVKVQEREREGEGKLWPSQIVTRHPR